MSPMTRMRNAIVADWGMDVGVMRLEAAETSPRGWSLELSCKGPGVTSCSVIVIWTSIAVVGWWEAMDKRLL